LGVISSRIYDAVIFMVITTTLAAPPLLKVAYKKTRHPLVKELPVA
jgi:hypothetical protein